MTEEKRYTPYIIKEEGIMGINALIVGVRRDDGLVLDLQDTSDLLNEQDERIKRLIQLRNIHYRNREDLATAYNNMVELIEKEIVLDTMTVSEYKERIVETLKNACVEDYLYNGLEENE